VLIWYFQDEFINVDGNGAINILIWLSVVKGKSSLTCCFGGYMVNRLQGMRKNGAFCATFDQSDIRGFYRKTCPRRRAASLSKLKFGTALFRGYQRALR